MQFSLVLLKVFAAKGIIVGCLDCFLSPGQFDLMRVPNPLAWLSVKIVGPTLQVISFQELSEGLNEAFNSISQYYAHAEKEVSAACRAPNGLPARFND